MTRETKSPRGRLDSVGWTSSWLLFAAGVIVLANSAALLYAFKRLSALAPVVRTSVLVTGPRAARQYEAAARSERPQRLEVEFYSDFDCGYCRESFPVIDSARTLFGDSVAWVHRYVANLQSDLSVGAALAGVCTSDGTGPWHLMRAITSPARSAWEWSAAVLDEAVASLVVNAAALEGCLDADSILLHVWSDIMRARARGIEATPTTIVDGVEVIGRLHYRPLVELLRSRLQQRQGPF